MTFSNTPITAGSGSTQYAQQYKKHFGDRPVAFALSTRSPPPAASSSATGAGVDADTQAALANLGWKIRSRVNQGYSRASTQVGVDGGFVSEVEVLRNVTNTRRAWSRVSTAPTVAGNFDELRTGTLAPRSTEEDRVALKRSRRLSEEPAMQETDEMCIDQAAPRRIAGLPKLSFSSSVSSTSSLEDPVSRTLARSHSSVHNTWQPSDHSAGHAESMDTDMPMPDKLSGAGTDGYDFSSHFNRTDF